MSKSRRVYSTDHGRMCPDCDRLVAACRCKSKRASKSAEGDGVVRVGRSTKGRRGKGVTVVTGLPLDDAALRKLAKALKARCGAGGAVKDGAIEIQGEHRDVLVDVLAARGYTVKRVGG